MLGDFLVVASSVVTLFFMMGVGFFFGKRGMLYSDTLSQLSRLLLTVVCPCTVINALQVERSTQLLAGMGQALLLVAVSYVVFGGAAHFLFPRQSAPTRAALRFGTVYGNVGFMGLPLVMSVLGRERYPTVPWASQCSMWPTGPMASRLWDRREASGGRYSTPE